MTEQQSTLRKEKSSHPSVSQPSGTSPFLARLAGVLGVAAVMTSASATNLVNDTWRDTERYQPAPPAYSENGTDSDADGNLESIWYNTDNSTTTMTIVDDSTPGGDYMLRTVPNFTGSASWTTYFTPAASPVTLASVGDQLKLTWKFTPTGVDATNTANTGQNFRLCVVNWPEGSTARQTTNGAPGSATYDGYAMFINMRTNLNRSTPFQLMKRVNPGTASAFLSASGSWSGLASDGSTGQIGYEDGTNYTFYFQAKLLAGGQLEITSSMTGGNLSGDGQLSLTYTDAAPTTVTFDTFGIRPTAGNLTATNFDTTLFKVEFIPGGCSPTAYTVGGSTTVCSGGTAAVTLSGSDTGVDYHLRVGGSPTGIILPGTGSPLNFGLVVPGTYTVYASNTSITCEGLMSGSAVISQYASPAVTQDPTPALATNTIGSTRVFSITATGPGLTYKWRKDTVELNNGGNISGANTATLTLSSLTVGDSGNYDCVVSNSPCGESTTSASANLAVVSGTGILFRSVNSGNWSDAAIWEQSANGISWTPASAAPSSLDSNIVVQASHTVVVDVDVSADQLTVQSGGTLSVQTGNLTLSNGDGVDCTVAGTLEVGAGTGNIIQVSATMEVGNGGVFNWNRAAAPAIPTATWQNGSTCRITQINTGSSALASGVGGQSYYDFIYDTTAGGQVASARCRLNITNNTEARRDFTIKVADATSASVTILNAANTVLTVGRDVTFETQTNSGNGNKVLLANAAVTGLGIKVGRNFSATGYLDGFGSASTLLEFTGAGPHSLTLPVQPFLITSSAMNWDVNNGATVQLASTIDGFNSFTNNGTLNFGAFQIIRGSALVLNSGGTVIGNSTNLLTVTNAVSGLASITAGGTLSLPSLPTFAGGESFLLFQAGAHTGSFSAISPATPGAGQTWDATLLGSDGILSVVAGGGGPATNPTNLVSSVSGGNLTLSWPADHLGWTLQTQTNSRSVGLVPATNAWFDVAGSTAVTNIVIPISPTNPTVFYRLRLFVP